MPKRDLRGLMMDPAFDSMSLADQTDIMRQAGAPDEMLSEWVERNAKGPMVSPGGSSKQGFEDTSQDVAAILEKYHEPNRARDILPRLGMFAAQGALAGVPASWAAKAAAARGLPLATKAANVGKAALKAGAYGVAGAAEDKALRSVGVPPGVSEVIVAATGLTTKPGRAMIKAGAEALSGGAAVAPAAEAAKATSLVEEIPAQILKWKNEQKFSGAQIISSLRNVYGISPKDGSKMMKLVLEGQAPKATTALQAERVQVGAQNVGRSLGITKEEVRELAGPVVGEARGAASPVFPQKAFDAIYDKMLSMPKAERLAYAASAKGEKAMSQVETIRRVFERAGIVVSAAAIADAIRRREES